MNMESKEKASNDLEQYIVLDSITVCLERLNNEISEKDKKIKKLYFILQLQIIIAAIAIIYLLLR